MRERLPDVVVPDLSMPRYNIAPSQPIAVVANGERKHVKLLRWGLIPSWAKEASIGDPTINARGESVTTKPSFRGPCRRRRCLVLADGFCSCHPEPVAI